MRTSEIITYCYLCSQGIKLFRWRLERIPRACQLPFTYGVHSFYSGDRTPGGPKGFEAKHGTRESFHGVMVLLYEVIEIFRVADNNGCLLSLVVVLNRCRVAPTLIDGDFLRQALSANGLA